MSPSSFFAQSFSWVSLLPIVQAVVAKGPEAVALLKDALTHAGAVVTDFEKLAALIGPALPAMTAPASGPVALSVDESEAKAKVLALLGEDGGPHASALGDGKWGERIGNVLKNPLVQSILAGLLQKYLGGLLPGMGS